MAKIGEKLWNWGHLEGSHNDCTGMQCAMTPEQFAAEYHIPNAFIVSYGGNIQPPYGVFEERFSAFKEIKWSVLGDASTPIPEARLGNTQDVLDALSTTMPITGGIVDDFFSPERMKRFPPEVLKDIKTALNAAGKDFWCVLYDFQLDLDLAPYLECFDGITFWIWDCADIADKEQHLDKVFALAGEKPVMLGTYVWNYNKNQPMDTALFETQLSCYFELLKNGRIEGIIVCASTLGDADLETNRVLKQYIARYENEEIVKN